MKVRVCTECGSRNPENAWYCANCRETLSVDTLIDADSEIPGAQNICRPSTKVERSHGAQTERKVCPPNYKKSIVGLVGGLTWIVVSCQLISQPALADLIHPKLFSLLVSIVTIIMALYGLWIIVLGIRTWPREKTSTVFLSSALIVLGIALVGIFILVVIAPLLPLGPET